MPGLLNPEDGSYAAPPAGPSKTQGYLDTRQANLPPKESFMPGDNSRFLPSTNRRGDPHPRYAGQVDPPLPGADPDPKNPSQTGGPGGTPPPATTATSSATVDYEVAGRNAVWIDSYLKENLEGRDPVGFTMLHAREMDQMNQLLKRVRGQGAVARKNGELMLRRFLAPKIARFKAKGNEIRTQKKAGLLDEANPQSVAKDFSKSYKEYIRSLKAKRI